MHTVNGSPSQRHPPTSPPTVLGTNPSSRTRHHASAPSRSRSIRFKWLRDRLKRIGKALRPRATRRKNVKSSNRSKYKREGTILAQISGKEHKATAIITFDTASDHNIVSEDFLKRGFPTLTYGGEPEKAFAQGAAGEELISKGTVPLDWYCTRVDRPGKGPQTRAKFEKGTFHIMKASHFDILVGWPDIQELDLFPPNPEVFGTVATVVTVPTDLTGCDVAKDEADAAVRREKERKEAEERKRKKKEEEAKKR